MQAKQWALIVTDLSFDIYPFVVVVLSIMELSSQPLWCSACP